METSQEILDDDWVVVDGHTSEDLPVVDEEDDARVRAQIEARTRAEHEYELFQLRFEKELPETPLGKNQTRPYKYQPLESGPWIRVLRIDTGVDEDPLSCQLRRFRLHEAQGNYDALSYVWGPETPKHEVQIDGKTLEIRQNLARFLYSIRSAETPIYVWADAICIDQESIQEKNHQVQQMKDVYTKSNTTRVWLGKLPHDVVDLFTSAKLQYARWHFPSHVSPEVVFSGLKGIVENPYLSRLWIVQEVILSTSIKVRLDTVDIPWTNFIQICKAAASAMAAADKSTHGLVSKLSRGNMLKLDTQRFEATPRSILDLVISFGSCACMDVRDRVYGLLGLASDLEIAVDYNLSNIELFQLVLRSCKSQAISDLARPLLLSLDVASQVPTPPGVLSHIMVPIEIFSCGTLGESSTLHWGPTWKGEGTALVEHSHHQVPILPGEALYTFAHALREPEDVELQNTTCLLVVLRPFKPYASDGSPRSRNVANMRYVAGILVAYSSIRIEAPEIAGRPVTKKLFREAVAYTRSPNPTSLTLKIDLNELLFLCRNFKL